MSVIPLEYLYPFKSFPKIPRLNRDIIVTEKIDGTNAQIVISEDGQILAGSRTRYLSVDNDHYGFAQWVEGNKEDLLKLGPGRHSGEWWGSKIQRNYGLKNGERRFSLFNVSRWCGPASSTLHPDVWKRDPATGEATFQQHVPECCRVVPTLYRGPFSELEIQGCLSSLRERGSWAAPGFKDPEGIVVYHCAANQTFKVTLHGDEVPKSFLKNNS